MMNESEKTEKTGVTTVDTPSTKEEMTEEMCKGFWRLKPNIVLRVEDDGAILFNPDTDGMAFINLTGSALLQWRRDRICFDEWCEALYKHYNEKTDLAQIQANVKKFLESILHFVEAYDGKSN